jgi:hypothetical protein
VSLRISSSRQASIPRPREAKSLLTLKVACQKILPSAKEHAKLRLTPNIWTAMVLTNGVKGVVYSIIYAEGSKPPELPVAIIRTFEH